MSRAPTPAEQRCLKALYQLGAATRPVASPEVANRLQARPPTVAAAVLRLTAAGWVSREARVGARLTPLGLAEARRVVRRQRLVELLLARVLGLGPDEAAAEADALQHAISPSVEQAIAAHLGEPPDDEQVPDSSPR